MWTQQSAPILLQQLQSAELAPEERVKRWVALQAQLQEKIGVLEDLGNEAKQLISGKPMIYYDILYKPSAMHHLRNIK